MQPDPFHQCNSILIPGADPFRHGPQCACDIDAPRTLPVAADGRTSWTTTAALASQLIAVLDGTAYAYPAPGQDTGDFARDQLARAAAAALWHLIAHAIHTDDEHHLEAFAEAMFGPGRIPADAAEVLGPPFADIARFIITTIQAQRAGAEPETTS